MVGHRCYGQKGHEVVVRLLLKKGADLESKDRKYGLAPLSCAAESGHKAVVKLLVEKGAKLDSKSKHGQTSLSWAARKVYKAVVKLLLEKGADLESKDNYGQTPLSYAAERGHEAVVKLLLENGAEPESKDKPYGSTDALLGVGFEGIEIGQQGCDGLIKYGYRRLPAYHLGCIAYAPSDLNSRQAVHYSLSAH
jgi:hypothetical protein